VKLTSLEHATGTPQGNTQESCKQETLRKLWLDAKTEDRYLSKKHEYARGKLCTKTYIALFGDSLPRHWKAQPPVAMYSLPETGTRLLSRFLSARRHENRHYASRRQS